MGALFGARPKGPSLAQKTQDFYAQQQNAVAAGRQDTADRASRQALLDQSLAQQNAAQEEELKRLKNPGIQSSQNLGGGFFGLGGTGSRGTFLS